MEKESSSKSTNETACRLCGVSRPNLVDVQRTYKRNGVKTTFQEVFNTCSPLKIKAEDPYPKKLCIDCISELLRTYEFHLKCLKIPELFNHKIDSSPSPKRSRLDDSEETDDVSESSPEVAKRRTRDDDGDDNYKKVVIEGSTLLFKPTPKKSVTAVTINEELGFFKYNILKGYKSSSHCVFEANGFIYINTRSTAQRRYLRCASNKTCPAKASVDYKSKTELANMMYVYKLHNHAEDTMHITKRKFLDEMRIIATEGNYTPKQVYDIGIKRYPELKDLMPYSSLCSRLYRLSTSIMSNNQMYLNTLMKYGNYLATHKPKKYCNTTLNETFFQEAFWDEENENDAVLIFCNQIIIDGLSWSKEIFIDSRFQITFEDEEKYNFLTICITVNEFRIPVFFALMQTATREIYKKIFTLFKEKYAPKLEPKEIITDYHVDLFGAISEVYHSCKISGSLIHYIFYIYKQCKTLEKLRDIETSPPCMRLQQKLFSLPLLPPHLIQAAFEYLASEAEQAGIAEIFRPIFEYIENVWINNVTPQVLSCFCSLNCINENIFVTFKKIRDIISSSKKFGFFELNAKLLSLEEWTWSAYQKILAGDKIAKSITRSRYTRILERIWQPEHLEKFNLNHFFECVGPLIEKMTGLIWIWGFYNYEGGNDDVLITPHEFYGADSTDKDGEESEIREERYIEKDDDADRTESVNQLGCE